MTNDLFVFATTAVFREHIDLGNSLPGRNWHLLYVSQGTEVIKQISRIKKPYARQLFNDFLLIDVGRFAQCTSAHFDIGLDVRQLPHCPDIAIRHLPTFEFVASRLESVTTILVGISDHMITEPALLSRQTVFVSACR